jgi:hypothetical protein
MASVVRPIFQNGERLTAQRLNEAVEYCVTSLRRALLAPLSPGVAIGHELRAGLVEAGEASALMRVGAGVSIDGLGRILFLAAEIRFTIAEVRAQIADLAFGDRFLVSLAAGRGDRTIADPCAPTLGSVLERVELYFERIERVRAEHATLTVAEASFAPSVQPWAESLDPAVSARTYAVPLGSVTYQTDGSFTPSMAERAGVTPTFAALRNSYGDVSMRLDRVDDQATLELVVPTTFSAPTGGPQAQAAVLATNVGSPPAGRPSPADPTVFEAAGGPGAAGIPGTSGVVAISMQYDATTGTANGGFAAVPRSGFPLVLSPAATTAPMVAPPGRDATGLIGLSAGPSYADRSDPTGARILVPVATAGLIQAWVYVGAALAVGTALTPAGCAVAGRWGLETIGNEGGFAVAQTALPLTPATVPGLQLTWVWVAPPYSVPSTYALPALEAKVTTPRD